MNTDNAKNNKEDIVQENRKKDINYFLEIEKSEKVYFDMLMIEERHRESIRKLINIYLESHDLLIDITFLKKDGHH